MTGMHKFARVRQTTDNWYAFYTCPNPYGSGLFPAKTTRTRKRPSKVPCLFRVEYSNKRLRKKGAN